MNDINSSQNLLITGAGSGIGKAIAYTLAPFGHLALVDLNAQSVAQVASELRNITDEVIVFDADITDEKHVEKIARDVESHFGKLAAVIHCAGISERKSLFDITVQDWNHMLDINLKGTFMVSKFLAPILQEDGAFVILSSGSAFTGSGGGAHYATSKAAQLGLVRGLARELSERRIRVNAICPRSIRTPMLDSLYKENMLGLETNIPLGRLGTAQDIASLARYLVIEDKFMTGQWLLVDGGRTYSL
jgi:3-oxoacyl-[acyl-carrier protein] reductase